LNICSRFGDTWDWVAYEPERQQAAAAGALGAAEDAPTADEGVIYEDMLKGAYFGAKTKTFEDYLILTNTPYPGKEIRRISAKSSQENAYSQFPRRRIHLLSYAVSMKITIQRYKDTYMLGMYIVLIVNFARTPRDTPQYAVLA
ncbi:hypothetical protein Tco_1330548, partial [Tanacetum coccineum]